MDNAGKLATQDEEKQDKDITQYVLDTTIRKQTQITKLIHQPFHFYVKCSLYLFEMFDFPRQFHMTRQCRCIRISCF